MNKVFSVFQLLKLKKFFALNILLILFIGNGIVNGATRTATVSGNWNATTTWGGSSVPTANDDVTIKSGVTVTVNISTAICKNLQVGVKNNSAGTIAFNSGSILTVTGNGTFGEKHPVFPATGSIQMTNGGLLKIGGALTVQYLGTWTPGTGTIEYNGSGNQTVYENLYNNLTLSGSGVKILTPGMTKINGNFTLSGTATTTGVIGLTIGGDVILGPVTTFNGGVLAHNVAGNWTNNGGTFVPGTGSVTFNGKSSVINGTVATQTFYNVNVAKTAGQTLSTGESTTTLNVSNNLTITSGVLTIPASALLSVVNTTNLNSNPSLIVKSNATSTGSFVYNTFSGSGTVKVERFMSKSDNWHLYSSPIKDQSVHDFLKFNTEIPDLLDGSNNVIGVGLRDYNTATGIWNPYLIYATASTTAGSISGGKGFSIRTYNDTQATGSIDATGIPNLNTVNVTLIRSAASTDKGWNCIGNPFSSALNIIGFLTANSAQLESGYEAVYLWDTNNIIPGKSSPDYVVLNNASSITNVQIAQGFFVKSKSGGGTVSFTKTMQNPLAALTFKEAVIEWPSLKIIASSQATSSSTEIKFIPNTSKGLDPGYDAGMLKANPEFSLYSRLVDDDGIDFTLQCLSDQDFKQYEIPMGIDYKLGGALTFKAESINLPAGFQVVLEDRLTKSFTRLDLKDAKYSTDVSAGTKGTGRFFLHASDIINGDPKLEEQPFKVYTIGKAIYVNDEVSADAKFSLYSVNGKLLANFKAESQVENRLDVSGLPSGVYVLSVSDKNMKKSVKLILGH